MKKEQFELVKQSLEAINLLAKKQVEKVNANVKQLQDLKQDKLASEIKQIKDYEEVLEDIQYSSDSEKKKYEKIFELRYQRAEKNKAYEKVSTFDEIAKKVYAYYEKYYKYILDDIAYRVTNIIFASCDSKRDYTQVKNYIDENYKDFYFSYYNDYNSLLFHFNNVCNIDNKLFKRFQSYVCVKDFTEYDKNYHTVFTDNSFKVAKSKYQMQDLKELQNELLTYDKAFENASQVYELQQKQALEKKAFEDLQQQQMQQVNKLVLL